MPLTQAPILAIPLTPDGQGLFGVIIIPIVVVAVIAAAYYGHLQREKRRQALLEMATRLGLSFHPGYDTSHDEVYAHFEIFRRGFDRRSYNTMSGALPVLERTFPCKLGDFTYKTREGSGKNRRTVTHRFSYLICHLPFTGVPNVLIRREGMFDKLAGVFGMDDIDFESAEFSRAFHVKSPDKKFAYDLCHQRMIEFLLRSNPPAIDMEHGRICLSDGNRQWHPAQFENLIAWLHEYLELWPDFLLKQLDRETQQPAGRGWA